MVLLVSRARRYFSATATDEMLDLFVPDMCPFDKYRFRAQAIMCLFIPMSDPQSIQKAAEVVFQQMDLVENVMWLLLFTLFWFLSLDANWL